MVGPPELITSTLQTGPGPAPMVAAGEAWTSHAGQLVAQAGQYQSIVLFGASRWLSPAGVKMTASAAKMTVYLGVAAALAGKAAAQCAAQATAYETAFWGVPQMLEMAENHTTHAVLEGTNFMGINTVPIGANEFDYLVRMTGQAHSTMAGYSSETGANLAALPAFSMPQPMTVPGSGLEGLASSGFLAAAGVPQKIGRDAIFAAVGAESLFSNAAQQGGRLAATVGEGEQRAREIASAAGMAGQSAGQQATLNSADGGGQMAQMMSGAQGMVSSLPNQVSQVGSQLTQGPSGMAQQFQGLLQPFLQMAQGGGYGTDATGTPVSQLGLLGANPMSNHPMLGGTGPLGGGSGLLTGSALPGAGGTSARSPLLASLSSASASAPSAAVEPAASLSGARPGAAPVSAMPMGAHGAQNNSEEGTVDQLVAQAPLQFTEEHDELDQWPV
ncbi:PPE family protein [Mycobacteroides abscessus]|uniref:PPE family protein n=1 Tax=Mycobacteroides abscessus TaxID=36809 RepID=UPI00266B66E8|nr:PPE domain-containing protein [Mycobacteroides abscessus]MDO3331498.1 PPE domain-containing protein [Mycobacteroides abscessus subsp. abscessus]